MEKIAFLILIFCFSFNDVSSQNVDTLNRYDYEPYYAPEACYPLSKKSQHVLMSEWINYQKWSTDKPFDNLYELYCNNENGFKDIEINNPLYMFFNDEKLYMVSYEPFSDQYYKNRHYTRNLYLYYLDGHVWKKASDILMEHYSIKPKKGDQKRIEYYARQYKEFNIKKMGNGIVKIKLTGNINNRIPYNLTVVLEEKGDGTYWTSSKLIEK